MQDSIEFLLRVANRRSEKLANQQLAQYDLTSTQYRTLLYLSHRQPMTVRQCDIENFFSKSNPAVTGILNNMEQKGLVQRVVNPVDARSKVLLVTEKGLEMAAQLEQWRGTMDQLLTEGMSAEEKTILAVLLKKMIHNPNLQNQ